MGSLLLLRHQTQQIPSPSYLPPPAGRRAHCSKNVKVPPLTPLGLCGERRGRGVALALGGGHDKGARMFNMCAKEQASRGGALCMCVCVCDTREKCLAFFLFLTHFALSSATWLLSQLRLLSPSSSVCVLSPIPACVTRQAFKLGFSLSHRLQMRGSSSIPHSYVHICVSVSVAAFVPYFHKLNWPCQK